MTDSFSSEELTVIRKLAERGLVAISAYEELLDSVIPKLQNLEQVALASLEKLESLFEQKNYDLQDFINKKPEAWSRTARGQRAVKFVQTLSMFEHDLSLIREYYFVNLNDVVVDDDPSPTKLLNEILDGALERAPEVEEG